MKHHKVFYNVGNSLKDIAQKGKKLVSTVGASAANIGVQGSVLGSRLVSSITKNKNNDIPSETYSVDGDENDE